jgi:hypothetical protein
MMLGCVAVREWLLVLSPIVTVVYFVIFPHHLAASVHWIARMMH